jgi:phosphohistidine phosphatase
MKLYLIQHGEALPEEINPERPLSEKGISDVNRTAEFLKRAGTKINTILHSGKIRAQQSAQILADILNPGCSVVERKGLAPNDPIDEIYREILERNDDLMIVGHLPHLAKLTAKLLQSLEDKNVIEFKQGCVLLLERMENSWKVKYFINPELV